mmetsp:Transcript_82643/g.237562  ORF Transcript_82643/g.237562 Transcript_82643/m.237562 type:complete len:140 (+) Transcript_82643:761-1180(+)
MRFTTPPPPDRRSSAPDRRSRLGAPWQLAGQLRDGGPDNKMAAAAAPCTVALADVLACGEGVVVLDRRGRGGFGATLLWKTPGVRGIRIEGGAIPDGEQVALLSAPQPIESDGDFVLVRAADGRQGWTKVANIRLPSSS